MFQEDIRITKTRKALHDAFFNIIQNKSIEDLSITDLCSKAKINRGTFYRHYKTKDELINEIIDLISNEIVQAYYEPFEHNPLLTPTTIDSNTIAIFQHIYNYKSFYAIIFGPNGSIHNHSIFYDKMRELIMDALHLENNNDKINHALSASYQTYAIIGMIIEWVRTDFEYSVSYMNEQFKINLQQFF